LPFRAPPFDQPFIERIREPGQVGVIKT